MKVRRLIGYWRNERHPEFPDPQSMVASTWDEEERDAVWSYLSSGTMALGFMGKSPWRLCGEDNGALEFTDGVYQWPEGLGHYVNEHSVRLPDEVVTHEVERFDLLDAASPSPTGGWPKRANTEPRTVMPRWGEHERVP